VGESERNELADLLRVKVARHADDALGTDGHEGQGEAVVAAEHRDVAAQSRDDLVDAVDAAAGLLDVGTCGYLARRRSMTARRSPHRNDQESSRE
jgi:hypothetical protein